MGLIERLARSSRIASSSSPTRARPLRRSRPRRDAHCLMERAEHLQQIPGAVLDYVGAIVMDTDHVAPGGSIDRKYLLGLISDVAGDVAGSISNAAEDLVAGRVW